MDVNESASIFATKIFRRIFFIFDFSQIFCEAITIFGQFSPCIRCIRIASQEINQKSNEKIFQKWMSTYPHLFCQQRFSAVFFIFDFHFDFLRSNQDLRPILPVSP